MMQQVNYVPIIDRQVNNVRIIGPGRMDTDSSCLRSEYYLIDASKDLCSFGCTRGLVVMDWSAPAAVLVGGGEEASSSSSVCWFLFCRSFLIEELTLWAPCAHACWPAVDSYISQLLSVRWS